jgi:copper homeostasis protein
VTPRYILEISVESVEAALAAERGGVDRLELCANLREGGTTPPADLLRSVRERVRLPIFAMIRPRGGNFLYSDGEFAAMREAMHAARESGADGFVLGLLDAEGRVDVEHTRDLIAQASPLPVTFHRAFDACVDLRSALDDVIKTGATRVLTSGGKPTAPEAFSMLGELVRSAGERIVVMPGSGLQAGNIGEAVEATGAREYHAGLSSVASQAGGDLDGFEREVRKMVAALRAAAASKKVQ